ncbi:helix-turn-helix transcriptional regulator [Achromobacter seleniivolatilans]|uniref:Helix-turn-helix transcriptional regulator n=1 Tax=Achromobacter seleniivolatilans TaxID=3047478 RepID=A0ABY9LYW1_9BURK|nr:helix-turn-helix transcriptional regulator [Achromobacter sp. R39]WMD19949.1 helix-turn-helix transcriptional regulator [Achromobacter sp. R39]
MTPEQAFSRVLRRLRSEANKTQEQLAFESQLDRTYISLLERGLRQPTLRSMVQLSAALHMPPSTLMNYVEEVMNEIDAD